MTEWYRRTTWTAEDEVEFFNKLKRAHKYNRAQYLRVQALHLFETKDSKLLGVAESLACKILTDYPDARFETASTYALLGNIYSALNDNDKAILHYQKAIETERKYPVVLTDAYLAYAEVVMKTWHVDLFTDIERILLEKERIAIFPFQRYKTYIILAIINKYKADNAATQRFIALAKQNVEAKTSGFRYHKNLGLVKESDRWLETLLEE